MDRGMLYIIAGVVAVLVIVVGVEVGIEFGQDDRHRSQSEHERRPRADHAVIASP